MLPVSPWWVVQWWGAVCTTPQSTAPGYTTNSKRPAFDALFGGEDPVRVLKDLRDEITLECDDGTGGFPNPGAHNVKLYFVSVSSAGVRRSDPLSSPNVTITGGIFS